MRGSNELPLFLSYIAGITAALPYYRYSSGHVIALVIVGSFSKSRNYDEITDYNVKLRNLDLSCIYPYFTTMRK